MLEKINDLKGTVHRHKYEIFQIPFWNTQISRGQSDQIKTHSFGGMY